MPDRASRNRTLSCTEEEIVRLSREILRVDSPVSRQDIESRVMAGDIFKIAKHFPKSFVDLLILDPPYNLSKNFNGKAFGRKENEEYRRWFADLMKSLDHMLKPDATIYVCSDWMTSAIIQPVLEDKFFVRNRITWEREKGRGAKSNWKNNTEDVWFCTKSERYHFDVDAVKMKRRVLAPYRIMGQPKDWDQEETGNYRLTYPSNIWTDLTIPFWSMPENTDHPTQKPEKLIAKLILASSEREGFVFDPFLGSGTTVVVAEKLGRRWSGVEIDEEYLCWALKRVAAAREDPKIQGYEDGIFWERNSNFERRRETGKFGGSGADQADLF